MGIYLKISVSFLAVLFTVIAFSETKSLVPAPNTEIRSDVIVTSRFSSQKSKEPINDDLPDKEEEKPGWMRRQLHRFGRVTSAIGNKLGGFSSKITNALDKFCDIIKTIVPVIAAVCAVGQFEFCAAVSEAPVELVQALAVSNIDLNALDK